MRKVLTGPAGVRLELDSSEIFPDDPGQGTPAMVEYKGAYASFTCAACEGVVLGHYADIPLPLDAVLWLNSDEIDREVEALYAAGENGDF